MEANEGAMRPIRGFSYPLRVFRYRPALMLCLFSHLYDHGEEN
jgi:hypothetical protein